ncbi:MAG: amidase [Xanthomonadales bacterium]|nr:amidase [Xanthomonadales bacterium]NNK51661.1 amidase [Xanthomonadales bacterium]
MSIRSTSLNAFCGDLDLCLSGSDTGTLSGLTFAAKDVFDIAGHRTGAGNPDWLRTHPPAAQTASAVQLLLDAGATLVGKTHTDELTYSLNGENHHYGTPVNPNAPGRIPGGSSSGSAAATAGGLVDFALGTDTGGSVRLPASNCGIYGFRPTHGRVANDHVVPLAPSFDTVGWFARDTAVLSRVGEVLLGKDLVQPGAPQLLLGVDTFNMLFKEIRPSLDISINAFSQAFGSASEVNIYDGIAKDWMNSFRLLQGAEVWQCHGEWIRSTRPHFGPDIRDRFEWAASIDPAALAPATALRLTVKAKLDDLLGKAGVLCIPTSPSVALKKNAPSEELDMFRFRALSLLCVAGLAGLPQVSLPIAAFKGIPLGISLIGPRNSDRRLLDLVCRLNLYSSEN